MYENYDFAGNYAAQNSDKDKFQYLIESGYQNEHDVYIAPKGSLPDEDNVWMQIGRINEEWKDNGEQRFEGIFYDLDSTYPYDNFIDGSYSQTRKTLQKSLEDLKKSCNRNESWIKKHLERFYAESVLEITGI